VDDWIASVLDGGGPVGEPCDGLDYLGRCVDGVAEWCDGDTIQREDCAASGLDCGWTGDQYGYYCTSRTPTCRARDEVGYCENGTATYCVDGQTVWDDCAASGLVCVVDPDDGYARCGSPSGEDTGVADVGPSEDTGSGGSDAGLMDTGSAGGPDATVDGAGQVDEADELEGGKSTGGSDGCACTSTVPMTPSTPPALLVLAALALVRRRRAHETRC
jgi:MYXO-CTERM domain-containing protein